MLISADTFRMPYISALCSFIYKYKKPLILIQIHDINCGIYDYIKDRGDLHLAQWIDNAPATLLEKQNKIKRKNDKYFVNH